MDKEDVSQIYINIYNGISSVIKENKIKLSAATWMDLEIILSEVSRETNTISLNNTYGI